MEDRNSSRPVPLLVGTASNSQAGDGAALRTRASSGPQRCNLRHYRRPLDPAGQPKASEPHWWAR